MRKGLRKLKKIIVVSSSYVRSNGPSYPFTALDAPEKITWKISKFNGLKAYCLLPAVHLSPTQSISIWYEYRKFGESHHLPPGFAGGDLLLMCAMP